MVPIGRGQRELIIGDRQTGKTAVAIVPSLIRRTLTSTVSTLLSDKAVNGGSGGGEAQKFGAMEYTTVVSAAALKPCSSLRRTQAAPSVSTFEITGSMRSSSMMTRVKLAYRQLSLLLRRPPGRELTLVTYFTYTADCLNAQQR